MPATCPICNEPISIGDAVCSRCGFTLVGKTEAFPAVPAEQDAQPETSYVPVLKVVKGPYNGQEFAMSNGTFTIGRDPSCDLFLNNMTVSRLHAQITIDDSNKYLNSMLDAFAAGWLPANDQAFVGWKLDLNRPIQAILTGETDYMKALSDAETIFNTNNNR